MKAYEAVESERRFMPLLPVVARVDGRAFHAFTRGMQRPFDPAFRQAMLETTKALAEETNAVMAYTQSDEITLAWMASERGEIWFAGRVAKMTSQLGAIATLTFYRALRDLMPEFAERQPTFDARVWAVPTRGEAANVFLWREWDATKNSLSMAAAEYYSHSELHQKNGADKHEMLFAKGVNWNDYPASFKRGVYVQRRTLRTPFTASEIESLPPKHAARTDPSLIVERRQFAVLDMPPFGTVTNREAVVFDGAEPDTESIRCAG